MLILLLFAQLTPQLAAEANGLRFLSKKGVYTLTYTGKLYEQSTTLHYTILHYTTLHYTTLYYTILYHITIHRTAVHYTIPHYTHKILLRSKISILKLSREEKDIATTLKINPN